jgi:hypothetical protein
MNSTTTSTSQTDGAGFGSNPRSNEAPDMQQRQSGTNMYARSFLPTDPSNTPFDRKIWTSKMFGSSSTAAEPEHPIPHWAVPSSISPKTMRDSSRVSSSARGIIDKNRSPSVKDFGTGHGLSRKSEKWGNRPPITSMCF